MAELDSGREKLSLGPDKAELDRRIGAWSTDELIDAVTFLLEKLKLTGSYEDYMTGTIGSLHPNNDVFKDALRKVRLFLRQTSAKSPCSVGATGGIYIAERTDYSEYNEDSDMLATIKTLQQVYGYQ